MFAESGYSRAFEREADAGAAAYAIRMGWGAKSLADMLERIEKAQPDLQGMSWISSHPDTAERAKTLRELEAGAGR